MSSFAVKRWQLTLVVFFGLLAMGAQALITIPKAEDPTFPLPTFAVVAVLPGSTPRDVERLVVDPLEAKLDRLDDVKSIKTQIDDSLAIIQIEFVAGVDVDRKYDEVLREANALRPDLPAELARLEVRRFNAADVNIRQVALVGPDVPFRVLEDQARALERRLEGLAGVGDVSTQGFPEQEVRIELDIDRLVALGVSPLEVVQAVGADASEIPAGSVDAGARRLNVKTSGDYRSVAEIEETPVRAPGNGPVLRVRDLGEVALADGAPEVLVRFGGKRAVFVAAPQKEGQNIFEVQKRVDAELLAFERTLPDGVTLERGFDQAKNVEHRLTGFVRDFALAIALVLLTLLPLGVRASLVVMVSIPTSLAVGLTLLQVLGYSINQLSIVGFVIALGLLVDDSVVVVENIARFVRNGMPPQEAAIKATKQITVSVLGCTATLIFAFLPLLFLPGTAGQFIRSMPVAVVVTIAASLLVSLTIVPFLSSRLLKDDGKAHGNLVFRAMTWLIEGSYRRILNRAIAWPKTTVLIAALLFAGSLTLVPAIGFSLFPKANLPQFLITVDAPEGASLEETDRIVRKVEAVLAGHADVINVAANVGKGNPRIYYNVSQRDARPNYGEVFAELRDYEPRRADATFEAIRRELRSFPGARIQLKEFENGPPLDAPIALRVLGDDPEKIEKVAAEIEALMQRVPGTRSVRNPSKDKRTDLRVAIDREKAAALGISNPDVDKAVRLALSGVRAAGFRIDGRDEALDVRVTVAPSAESEQALAKNGWGTTGTRPGLSELDRIFVPTAAQGAVPLAAIARVELEPSATTLRHFKRERTALVTAEVERGFNTDKLTKAVLAEVDAVEKPAGVRVVPAGEIESRQESFGGLGAAILIAAFGVLSVLVLEFRTFKSTLIVASVIPLGVVGGLVALLVSGNTLSFTATIGFVALMGIEVKNSILLVDFTNQLRAEGVAIDEAIQQAGETRFVPILLTTLTALGGLIPLALERSPLYSPLALVLMGGLISSTLLARIVTPVVYKLLAPVVELESATEAPQNQLQNGEAAQSVQKQPSLA